MRRRAIAGFTLTELLVVLGIIMALAAAAVPAMSAFRRGQRLDHSGRIVTSAMNDARRMAITRRARHVVVLYSYEETPGELDTVRHALRIYQEPTGVKPAPGIPAEVTKGYWEGGYVGEALILPQNVRFKIENMETKMHLGLPDEKGQLFVRRNRGERSNDFIGFRRDGTIEPRVDVSPYIAAEAANIFLPDEGYFQVAEGQRADVAIMETDTGGREVLQKGKSRRALVDLNIGTGRAISRVFDIGDAPDRLVAPPPGG